MTTIGPVVYEPKDGDETELLAKEVIRLRAENAALFKLLAASRDHHEQPLEDVLKGAKW